MDEKISQLESKLKECERENDDLRETVKESDERRDDEVKALLSRRIMAGAKIVVCAQVGSAMLKGFDPTDMKGNVLHQDATTEFHTHYEGMQVTIKDGNNMSIGLSKVGGGDGATYTDVFKDIIEDLDSAYMCNSGDDNQNEVGAKLITSMKALMSDQCATKTKRRRSDAVL